MKHSLNGPSALERRELCPGSAQMEAGQPDRGNPDAERGKALHRAVELSILADQYTTVDNVHDAAIAMAALNDFDRDAANYCAGQVEELLHEYNVKYPGQISIVAEAWLDLVAIDPDIGGGTPDLLIITPALIHVVDYKFGIHPVTAADRNRQLQAYAIGALYKYGPANNLDSVRVTVLQPFGNRCSTHEYTQNKLEGMQHELRAIVAKTKAPSPPIVPGDKQCRNCKAAGVCRALATQSAGLTVKPINTLTLPEIGKFLTVAPLVKRWLDQLEERALAEAESGSEIPGFFLGEGRKTRVWAAPDTAADALRAAAHALGKPIAAVTNTEVASPAQIEAAWGKSKKVLAAIEPLMASKAGKPKLLPAKAT